GGWRGGGAIAVRGRIGRNAFGGRGHCPAAGSRTSLAGAAWTQQRVGKAWAAYRFNCCWITRHISASVTRSVASSSILPSSNAQESHARSPWGSNATSMSVTVYL